MRYALCALRFIAYDLHLAKEISKRDLKVALERKEDWLLRYPL